MSRAPQSRRRRPLNSATRASRQERQAPSRAPRQAPGQTQRPASRRHPVRRRSRHSALGGIAFILVLAIAVSGLFVWATYFRAQSSVEAGTPVTVTIAEGSNSKTIAQTLASKGVITNGNMFLWRLRKAGAENKLKAGTYQLAGKMPYETVIEALEKGPDVVETVKVTIPEGWRIEQVAARMEAKLGLSAEEFKQLASTGAEQFSARHPYLKDAYGGSLEGFLFPKTYQFPRSATATQVIETMLTQFDKEIGSAEIALAESRGYSMPQVVIMASIIEKETKLNEERPLVSSVIYNRLTRDWKLQMCSTVQILIGEDKLRLSESDLKIESPYNTYLHKGLPPGPICSPGLESLKAAANPVQSDYLYYVLTGKDGSQTFCVTEKEFQAAKKKSLEVFGE
ncbi:MAG: endolytic transglycosylase MltG [Coriobacteriia bacterium]